ncbi:MAG: 50S ribosomal protein L22 [Candidatus Omnitrophica bacterium]|nr:50S ribosomal protein L22 [Candidatus Omnitrophota bacterium]
MIAKAVAKYIRMSPRKVRYVMTPLRHRSVAEALSLLAVANRRASGPVAKAIGSAFANARQQDPTLGADQVVISRLTADGGPAWKRFRAAAFGRAAGIRKHTTHITVELDRITFASRKLLAGEKR